MVARGLAEERNLDAEREAYRNDGYVLLKHLFPPIVLWLPVRLGYQPGS